MKTVSHKTARIKTGSRKPSTLLPPFASPRRSSDRLAALRRVGTPTPPSTPPSTPSVSPRRHHDRRPVRRSERIREKGAPQPGLFEVTELVSEVARDLDHRSLMSMATSSRKNYSIAQYEVERRIRFLAKPFFPDFDKFHALMDKTGTVITSSLARLLYITNSKEAQEHVIYDDSGKLVEENFTHLSLVCPAGRLGDVQRFFHNIGYSDWNTIDQHDNFDNVSSEIVSATKVGSDKVKRTVTINESMTGVVPVVLASNLSSDLNFLSSTHAYCFFPNIALSNIAVSADYVSFYIDGANPEGAVDVRATNKHWASGCGKWCPTRVRKTVSDDACAIFKWSNKYRVPTSSVEGHDPLLASENVIWQFKKVCRNIHCENYQPARCPRHL